VAVWVRERVVEADQRARPRGCSTYFDMENQSNATELIWRTALTVTDVVELLLRALAFEDEDDKVGRTDMEICKSKLLWRSAGGAHLWRVDLQ
jgi:hypothetical protein